MIARYVKCKAILLIVKKEIWEIEIKISQLNNKRVLPIKRRISKNHNKKGLIV